MPVLITSSTSLLDRLVPETSRHSSSINLAQSMSSRHLCLCCANPLLRHVWLGKLYWRCSHCYQAMPVTEDAKEMLLFVSHGEALQPLLIFSKPLQEQQNGEQ